MSRSEEHINPNDRNRYSVIPRVLIFIFRKESVLLIKGSSTKKLWPGMYNGLGGHLEMGEDLLGSARRELREESGLVCSSMALCGIVIVDTGRNPGVAIYVFRGDYEGGEINSSAEGNLEWIDLDQVPQYPVVEDLRTILPMIAAQKPGSNPFSARYYYDVENNLRIKFTD
jgi:8-oxo-dGTP diphosphatase